MGRKRNTTGANEQALLVTVEEAKKMLNVGTNTIYVLINSGRLKRQKIGSLTRITVASIKRVAGVT